MARKPRLLSSTGYYHIVARGNGKQILFESYDDYFFFINKLHNCKDIEPFEVIAYCLMENHVHLLLRVDKGLDIIMKRILTSYAYYYNSKYDHVGHVFQNRYKSEIIENESSLLAVVRYIHNNPLKAGICLREKYPWSSWREYTGTSRLISPETVLGLTGGRAGFLQFSNAPDNSIFLDAIDRRRISDTMALEIIRKSLDVTSGTQLQSMNRENRNVALRVLKHKGLSIRQIERLTGINRGVIQNL